MAGLRTELELNNWVLFEAVKSMGFAAERWEEDMADSYSYRMGGDGKRCELWGQTA